MVTNLRAGPKLTLPIRIFNNIRLSHQQPVVNAVALVVTLASIVPVYFAQRLTGGPDIVAATAGAEGAPVA